MFRLMSAVYQKTRAALKNTRCLWLTGESSIEARVCRHTGRTPKTRNEKAGFACKPRRARPVAHRDFVALLARDNQHWPSERASSRHATGRAEALGIFQSCPSENILLRADQQLSLLNRFYTMWLRTNCYLEFNIEVSTPFVLMLRPRSGAQQWISSEIYKLTPNISAFEFTDGYGNLCQRLIAPPGFFSVHTSAQVMISDRVDRAPGARFVEIQNLPDEMLHYLLPSRFCESDLFCTMASTITGGQHPGYDQIAAIENWLRENIRYEPFNSDVQVSAVDVNARGWGVCRDFAHLGIALSRSLSIPARMVVGYLHGLQPMDLHAWFEAYVGDRWYSFDATQARTGQGYVALGYGRDAADVAVYNQFGPGVYPSLQRVSVEQIDHASADLDIAH